MSAVLARARETAEKIPPQALEDLETRPVSKIMRRQTWPDHERAEHSPFEQALVRGTVTEAAYADMLTQVWHVYDALEARMDELRDDPVAGTVLFGELPRRDAVEADLVHYAGPDWRATADILPVTREYAERIRTATPVQYVAHHYTRYLADLSGGFDIDRGITGAFGLEGTGGREYYQWPDIPDAMEFKAVYRQRLDALPINTAQKRELIDEVLVAYEFNIEMVRVLADNHTITLP